MRRFKIAVFGTGYVGLSNAILLAKENEVVAVDIVEEKVRLINHKKSPISDHEIQEYLSNRHLNLKATTDPKVACRDADFILIATPTNYDEKTNQFDTSSIESVLNVVKDLNPKAVIIIKSTVPVGYTKKMAGSGFKNIYFVPEFLREGRALYDNLYPSRIIVGGKGEYAHVIAEIMSNGALRKDVPVLFMESTEAEAVKLFSNTYLAMRVAYFNELDSYALEKELDVKQIIKGVVLDPRIGQGYCNPSFGYGGYCLPKDTKQLLANYSDVPQSLIRAIVESNAIRKKFIADRIVEMTPSCVGIFRLIMKSESDNYRASAIQDIILRLKEKNISLLIFEPTLKAAEYLGVNVTADLDSFKSSCDLILANRLSDQLVDVQYKVFSRDIFLNN